MAVLKEMRCTRCDRVQDAMVSGQRELEKLRCDGCDGVTVHQSRCSGGTGFRWRYLSWDGYAPGDSIRYDGVGARNVRTGEPERHLNGDVIHERRRFSDGERRSERRKQLTYERRRQRGSAPIRLDLKRGTSPRQGDT